MNTVDFLKYQAADDSPHHGIRTLFEHLLGTYKLLQNWGNEETICNAGLFHSIYAVTRLKNVPISQSMRCFIQDQIGMEAEQLSYLYCVTSRQEFYLSSAPCQFRVSGGEQVVAVSIAQYSFMLEIDAANIVDQIQHETGETESDVKYWLSACGKKYELLSKGAVVACQTTLQNLLPK